MFRHALSWIGLRSPWIGLVPVSFLASVKVKKNSEDKPDSIPSPSPLVKIQIIGMKVKKKPLLGFVNKLFVFKSFLTTPSNVSPLNLKQIFLAIF